MLKDLQHNGKYLSLKIKALAECPKIRGSPFNSRSMQIVHCSRCFEKLKYKEARR